MHKERRTTTNISKKSMANIYLDTNILIDLYERNQDRNKELVNHTLYVSPLSCHILSYTTKIKIPDSALNKLISNMTSVSLNKEILSRSLEGPTNDLEDNLQLHSAVTSHSDYFLTRDKRLLNMKYFGKLEIVDHL